MSRICRISKRSCNLRCHIDLSWWKFLSWIWKNIFRISSQIRHWWDGPKMSSCYHFVTILFPQILLDFSLRYKDIDCDAFLDSWPTNNVRLNDILTNQYETSVYTMWSQDIQDLLILLKLLPAKSNGRNLLSVQAFNKATEKLFVFRKVHLHNVPILFSF